MHDCYRVLPTSMGSLTSQLAALTVGAVLAVAAVRWAQRHSALFRRFRRKTLLEWSLARLVYPHILPRMRFAGPWSPLGLILRLTYVTVTVVALCFDCLDWGEAAQRAGEMAAVNLTFLYLCWRIEAVASFFFISLRLCHQLHASIGWMAIVLSTFHALVRLSGDARQTSRQTSVAGMIVCEVFPCR